MATKSFLMGAEVEYSMSSPQPDRRNRRVHYHKRLTDAIRSKHRWLPDCHSPTGIYIDNGSRYYLDTGNHNEFSSPESFTPRQIAIYDRAAERILLCAKETLRRDGIDVSITKNNVNFTMPDRAAWGQHEAYTCWAPLEVAAAQLIPHLVSRIPYAGAGYLSASMGGMGFELSQRARHMKRLTGAETTHDRAIFCTRAWKPSDVSSAGWTRTNLIAKDSQRCSFGMYLTYGVTGLLLMIINEGNQIGRNVQLRDPLAAMRAFSLDPWLQTRVPSTNGRQLTAIDIQREYLREAESHVDSGRYPVWTLEVLDHWATALDQLESDPWQLAPRLDGYLKLTVFDHQLTRQGMTWRELHSALGVLERMRSNAPEVVVRAVLNEDPSELDGQGRASYARLTKMRELKRGGLDRLRFAVRLQALELSYHELGGLFDCLAAAGEVDAVVVTPQEVDFAIHNPPGGGRAEARGKSISEFHGRRWACDWQYIVSHDEGKWVNLRDPFTATRQVEALSSSFPHRRSPADLAEMLAWMARME